MATTNNNEFIVMTAMSFHESMAALSEPRHTLAGDFLLGFQANPPRALKAKGVKLTALDGQQRYWQVSLPSQDPCCLLLQHDEEASYYVLLFIGSPGQLRDWALRHRLGINPHTCSLQYYENLEEEMSPAAAGAAAPAAALQAGPAARAAPAAAAAAASGGMSGAAAVAAGSAAAPAAAAQTAAVPAGAAPAPEAAAAAAATALFRDYGDDDLRAVGVPDDRLKLVRGLQSLPGLKAVRRYLPADAFEALVWLAEGETLEAVKEAYGAPPDLKAGIDAKILAERSSRSFHVVQSDVDMQGIINAPLAMWRVFLHPSQQRLVKRDPLHPLLIRGAAGTGKTVAAIHRAVYLIRQPEWDPSLKLLFTTFSKNLVQDLRKQIYSLCSPEERKRIEVTNVDAWVAAFLREHEVAGRRHLIYDNNPQYKLIEKEALECRDPALPYSAEFYREEWRQVILPHDVQTLEQYQKVSRRGRGTSLGRIAKKKIWPVFDAMRSGFSQNNCITFEDACYYCIHILDELGCSSRYGAVVVDEVQDLETPALMLLSRLATGKQPDGSITCALTLAGDGQQSIYRRRVNLTECGINVRGRSSVLKLTYRTTEEIRKCAVQILEGGNFSDLDGGKENSRSRSTSLRSGVIPETCICTSFSRECKWIKDKILELTGSGGGSGQGHYQMRDICVVARTESCASSGCQLYQEQLEQAGLKVVPLRRGTADSDEDGIRIATMHRVKGLEFKVIFIVGAKEGTIPGVYRGSYDADPGAEEEHYSTERSLFYVAATRARDLLFVTSPGRPGEFMRMLQGKAA